MHDAQREAASEKFPSDLPLRWAICRLDSATVPRFLRFKFHGRGCIIKTSPGSHPEFHRAFRLKNRAQMPMAAAKIYQLRLRERFSVLIMVISRRSRTPCYSQTPNVDVAICRMYIDTRQDWSSSQFLRDYQPSGGFYYTGNVRENYLKDASYLYGS